MHNNEKDLNQNEITITELVLKIRAVILYLRSKWISILFFAIIGAAIGFYYAFSQKSWYTATLTFALEGDTGGGLGGALGLASTFGFDVGGQAGGAFSESNLIELMKSRRLIEQTLLDTFSKNGDPISIAEKYIQINNWREEWQKKNPTLNKGIQFLPGSKRDKFTLQQDSVLGVIYSNLVKQNITVAQKDKKISIISIEAKTADEKFSKILVETLAKEVSEFYIDTKSKKSQLNVAILQKQSDSIRNVLNSAITGVAVANDNTYNLNPSMNVERTTSTRRQVDIQASTAILTELVKNLELAKISLRKETPLIQIIDTPILPLAKERMSKLKSLIIGGVLAGFFTVAFLIITRWWRKEITPQLNR